MAKWLAVATLLAMLLAMACPALAEVAKDNAISAEDLLGVWQMQDDDQLCVLILCTPTACGRRTVKSA